MALSATVYTFAVHGRTRGPGARPDRAGRLTAWIEVGAPDADRAHRGSKLADRVTVYTHRDPAKVLGPLIGKRIHRAEAIPLYAFGREFVESAVAALQRRNLVALSRHERLLYLELNGASMSTAVDEHGLDTSK
ncbi:YaeQ family protein [Nocardia thraciensis]